MCLIYYIIHVYIFFLPISLLSLSFCVCLLAFFSSRDLVFISTHSSLGVFRIIFLSVGKEKGARGGGPGLTQTSSAADRRDDR